MAFKPKGYRPPLPHELAAMRKEAGWLQEPLAAELGVAIRTWRRYEGDGMIPRATYYSFCRLIGKEPDR